MNLIRIVRSSPVGLVLVLLMVGCGTQAAVTGSQSSQSATEPAAVTGSQSSQSATEPAASPSTEGAGPESPQQAGDGGPAISAAQLPIGGAPVPGGNGNDYCFSLVINASLPAGAVVTVTDVEVSQGFNKAGGCPASSNKQCAAGFQFISGSAGCDVHVTWDLNNPPTANGTLVVKGTPSCPAGDAATCQTDLKQWEDQRPSLTIPAPPSGQSSPDDTSSP